METQTKAASLLGLPTELRIMICKAVQGERNWKAEAERPGEKFGMGDSFSHRGLSQTCIQIHEEIADVFYNKDQFTLDISNGSGPRHPFAPRQFHYLLGMREVHIDFGLRSTDTFDREIQMLKTAIELLRQSTELKTVTFHIAYSRFGSYGEHDYGKEMRPIIGDKANHLRRKATREGVRAGRNAKERELDYAASVADMLRCVPKWPLRPAPESCECLVCPSIVRGDAPEPDSG